MIIIIIIIALGCLSSKSRPFSLELLLSANLPKTGDDEKEPFLTGLDFLPDGRLLTVDNSNRKLIVLDEQLQILGTPYTFKTYPRDVAYMSQNELAVTLSKKIVSFLSVSTDHSTTLTREIKTTSEVYSLCCTSPSKLVVSTFNDPRPARIISVDGVESDFDRVKFPDKTYRSGENKCTYVQSKNTLVLTEKLAHTVYMYDTLKGTSRAVTDENIKEPRGTCIGPGDTVLVCSMRKNSIVQLTVDGEILGTYQVDMKMPNSICVSKDGTRLAISNNNKEFCELKLYKISPAHS
ncbi:hypothetical protein DPMN_079377 [Dreissena polymorpha]|uniref:Uncharacterized protein n=1 Tax=Dreissena polymorpha TaxID=45954 RepID=A0A9D3YTN4_DREPO|nr:hypothetical protein DPMN_079377 [Dreissena polymorpha]